MPTTTSSNMLMPVPVVGSESGPQYATDVNNCLTIIDGHNHTPGLGVQIPVSGLNINADLSLNGNNLTAARTLRLQVQNSTPAGSSDLDCLYVTGVDLYYIDGNGNNVRITQSGGVAGSPGSISNLTSPASAAYVSADSTFVWQSAANTSANLDCASILIRNLTANSKALTLNPPNSMGSNYSITLPSLPAATSFLTMDTSGNISASIVSPSNPSSESILQISNVGVVTASNNLPSATEVNGQLPVVANTNASNNLAIIRAGIDNGGAISSGEGIASVNITGQSWAITFSTSFADIPSVSALSNTSAAGAPVITSISSSSVTILWQGASNPGTMFLIAIGKRS